MAELLLEIGCEEMPARFLAPALKELAGRAEQKLAAARLDPAGIETQGTPRRLALIVRRLAASQTDQEQQAVGPPWPAAFDSSGSPSKAAQGFAKSQGVSVADLVQIDTPKGPRAGVVKRVAGQAALAVLPSLLEELIRELPFAKSMRWGSHKLRFARPIHWLLALLDGRVVPFSLTGISSGDTTRGHRFLSPAPIRVSGAADYLAKLEEAFVIVDRDQRRQMVAREVQAAAESAGGRLLPDDELLSENTDLVEYPIACCGSFDPQFLAVPRQVVITAMREHQRYFAVEDAQGKLLPNFVAVNNTKPKDLAVVTQGHQRVLRARLADAAFFLAEDTARPLHDFLADLKAVTYHAQLGTSYDKVMRFADLAQWLAEELRLERPDLVRRAAELCKCDLVSAMVGEFPSLQGQVGAEYARRSGEEDQVAQAIYEHYLPAGAGDRLPVGEIGTVVGLADRLDTICGLFGIGQVPSGAADPYGLRRAAIAVIRLVSEKGLKISFGEVLDKAIEGVRDLIQAPFEEDEVTRVIRPIEETKDHIAQFIRARFLALLVEQGIPTDVAKAVLNAGDPDSKNPTAGLDDLTATAARARALAAVKDSPDFAPLAAGLKRVINILRKEADQVPEGRPEPELMSEPAEKELHQAFGALAEDAAAQFAKGDFNGFLRRLSSLKVPIDKFFDHVMVMVEDAAIRHNRLALLNEISKLFGQLAEFSHLQLV